MKLSTCIRCFFVQYLPQIKGVSDHTTKSYRDTFSLFLPFAAKHLSIKIESLQLDHLSPDLILEFLYYLETERSNTGRTRNIRLATLKSFAKMVRLMYPGKRKLAERILSIPKKRTQKQLIGFLYPEEVFKVLEKVDIKKNDGPRDYTILQLLYDSGARASEIANLKLDYFDPHNQTLVILGKGNRYRQIKLSPKTTDLMKLYISKYRKDGKSLYQHRLFINKHGKGFTRHGIYFICKKYLFMALTAKRLNNINPAHSFRHSCAVKMLISGDSVSDIRNRLGHDNIQSTMVYLHMDLSSRKEVQKKFIEYTQSILKHDSKIEELIDWENDEEIMNWLDSL